MADAIPTDRILLPIGIEHEGRRYREVVIDEMIGADEEILANPKHKTVPARAITHLLQRVILEVPGVMEPKERAIRLADKRMVRGMYQPDRDAVLLGLRRLSFGNDIDVLWRCKRCDGDNEDRVDLSQIERRDWDEDAAPELDFVLPRGIPNGKKRARKGIIRFPTGVDTENISKLRSRDPGGATTAMLAILIADIEGVTVDQDVAKSMSSLDRQSLGVLFRERLPGDQLFTDLFCPECGASNEGHRLDLSGFFTPT